MVALNGCTSSPQIEEVSSPSCSYAQTHDSLKKEAPRIKKHFEKVMGGTPLVVPLIGSSDMVVPVSVNNNDTIDKLFLVQFTQKIYNYRVYKIHAVLRIFTESEMTYNVLVSNRFSVKTIEISGFNYHQIKRKINNNKWNGYKVRKPIPIIDIRTKTSSN